MSKIVQEKFQEEFPLRPSPSHAWATDKSARVKKGLPGREVYRGDVKAVRQSGARLFNTLPPGMDIDDQENADIRHQRMTMPGESDVSQDRPNSVAIHRGYFRRDMQPTDDLYTNEHVDMFYGEMSIEGDDGSMETGFLERGNTLDRL